MDDERRASFSLRRWSRRKLEAARRQDDPHAPRQSADNAAPIPKARSADATAQSIAVSVAPNAHSDISAAPLPAESTHVPLPPIESLTIDSDFSPFMQAGVDETVKREALRKLVRDPRFNVMDGLDVYIDDYSKPSPLDPTIARALMQARYVFAPPKTRVTAEGIVEDVPEAIDPDGIAAAEAPPSATTDVMQRVTSSETPQREEPSPEPQALPPSRTNDKPIE